MSGLETDLGVAVSRSSRSRRLDFTTTPAFRRAEGGRRVGMGLCLPRRQESCTPLVSAMLSFFRIGPRHPTSIRSPHFCYCSPPIMNLSASSAAARRFLWRSVRDGGLELVQVRCFAHPSSCRCRGPFLAQSRICETACSREGERCGRNSDISVSSGMHKPAGSSNEEPVWCHERKGSSSREG